MKRPCFVAAGLALLAACAHADTKADELLKHVAEKTKNINTLSARLEVGGKFGSSEQKFAYSLRVKRPNFARIEGLDKNDGTMVMDGKNFWSYMAPTKQYIKMPTGSDTRGASILNQIAPPVGYFFSLQVHNMFSEEPLAFQYGAPEQKNGEEYQVLQADLKGRKGTMKLYVDKELLIRRSLVSVSDDNLKMTQEAALEDVKLNEPMEDSLFAFVPPEGSKEFEPPKGDDFAAKLLKVGSKAPAFNLATPKGSKLSLAQAGKGKKATLVNFWFYG